MRFLFTVLGDVFPQALSNESDMTKSMLTQFTRSMVIRSSNAATSLTQNVSVLKAARQIMKLRDLAKLKHVSEDAVDGQDSGDGGAEEVVAVEDSDPGTPVSAIVVFLSLAIYI